MEFGASAKYDNIISTDEFGPHPLENIVFCGVGDFNSFENSLLISKIDRLR